MASIQSDYSDTALIKHRSGNASGYVNMGAPRALRSLGRVTRPLAWSEPGGQQSLGEISRIGCFRRSRCWTAPDGQRGECGVKVVMRHGLSP
jgi:hypothetical protein